MLKKIEILGFKSFAKRTVLDFLSVNNSAENNGEESSASEKNEKNEIREKKYLNHRPITAVVGPNGSGKSNIVDALRWVMGEQSLKLIRLKKSQDVIFGGSQKKAQIGSAEVKLFLDNSAKKIPLDFEEVIISRKAFRSGENEYFINGSKVRLLDLLELLSKIGLGQKSYCIINQGMTDQILNASAVDRRAIFEEAAGVKEFQIKKERSRRKLKATGENLEKVKGILVELEPHLKLLKKQSEKIEKSRQYRLELREKQEKLFGFLWEAMEKEKSRISTENEKIIEEKNILEANLQKIQIAIRTENQGNSNIHLAINQNEEQKRNLNRQINEVERQALLLSGKMELEKESLKKIQEFEVIPVGAELVKKELLEIRVAQNDLVKKLEAARRLDQLEFLKKYAQKILDQLQELYNAIVQGKVSKKRPEKIIEDQKKAGQKRIDEIEKQIKTFQEKQKQLQLELLKLEKTSQDLIERQKNEQKNSIENEDKLRRGQFELERVKEKLNNFRVETAKIEVKEEDLIERIKNDLKIEINLVGGKSPLETITEILPKNSEAIDVGKLNQEIDRLRWKLEQAGGVDESVVKEFQETKERFEFLQKESIDLQEAMGKLKAVIKQMDAQIKKNFISSFEEINKNFQKYFETIFGGGKAKLEKIEIKPIFRAEENFEASKMSDKNIAPEKNGLENLSELEIESENSEEKKEAQIGIEIFAQPPGKRISNLGMLSGGERTLTSLALLFAIVAHNPPPFAFLDEVEAALDEANSRRFGKILHEFSKKTQFVLITHNRQTMREASILYGVTMGDDGISKLLSVKLEKEKQEA